MRNQNLIYPGRLLRADRNGTETVYPSSSFYDCVSSSGYVGQRPKPLVPHNFSYEILQARLTENSSEAYTSRGVYQGTTTWTGDALNTQASISVDAPQFSLYDEALESLNAKSRGDLDLSVDLAESHQTRKMVSAVHRAEYLARLAKRKFRVARMISDAWLEFTYGWKPLASTIYGVADNLLDVSVSPFDRFKVRRTRNFHGLKVSVYLYSGASRQFMLSGPFKVSSSFQVCLRSSNAFNPARWSSLNPASIAWELMPYSFVVDWVVDVGSYLRNLETSVVYADSFVNGFFSNLIAYDSGLADTVVTSFGDYFARFDYVQNFSGHVKYRKFNRTVLTEYPVPKLPGINVQLGSSRLLSAAALLAQQLK